MEHPSEILKGGQFTFSPMDPLSLDEDELKSGVQIDLDNSGNNFPKSNVILAQIKSKSMIIPGGNCHGNNMTFSDKIFNIKQAKIRDGLPLPIRDSRKMSSFIQVFISTKISAFDKFTYCMNNFFIVHCIVVFLSVLKIIFQNYYHKNCWMDKICICPSDIQTKIYSAMLYFFLHLNILVISISKTTIEINFETPNTRMFCFAFYFACCFLFSFSYLLSIDLMNALPMYLFFIVFSLVFPMKRLFDWKGFSFRWVKYVLKTNVFGLLILGHYSLCTRIFPELNSYIFDNFDISSAKNWIRLYQFFYFKVFSTLFLQLFHVYNDCILEFHYNEYSSTIVLIIICSVFFVSVPISGIITMEDFSEWGGWLLLVSYAHFIFTYYTRFDINGYVIKKILNFCHINKANEQFKQKNENDMLCSQLISGCLIDMVFLINSRLMVLIITRRWMTFPVHELYYADCGFLISDKFTMNNFGAFAIITVNFVISGVLLLYMKCKNEFFLDYKKPKNYFLNLYFLLLLHSFFEGCIQMVVGANQQDITTEN